MQARSIAVLPARAKAPVPAAAAFGAGPHPDRARLRHIAVDRCVVRRFVAQTREIEVRNPEGAPMVLQSDRR